MGVSESWNFYLPTRVVFGRDSLKNLESVIRLLKSDRIMLVTGRKSMKEAGVLDRIMGYLEHYQIATYANVNLNPTVEMVEDGIRFLRNKECSSVIALGGGSVIDAAKAISLLSENPDPVEEYLSQDKHIANRRLPLVAIPTTGGTGTEVTQYASIVSETRKRKISLTHEYLHPDVAVIDPVLMSTMSKFLTATTGLDALAQCVEAYWSKSGTAMSDIFALSGIKLVFENLRNAHDFPQNLEHREGMALAGLFSGIAISISKTTIVHSVSYPLTVHFNVPHGLACSLTLPSFLRYNSRAVERRILDIARAISARTVEECALKIEGLISDLGLPNRLSDVGIRSNDIDLIVKEGFRPDRAENNPVEVTEGDLRDILRQIL